MNEKERYILLRLLLIGVIIALVASSVFISKITGNNIFKSSASQDIVIINDYVSITLTSDGFSKPIQSGQSLIGTIAPFSRIYLNDSFPKGTAINSNNITSLGNGLYQVGYAGINTQTLLNITPKNNYFIFKIVNITNLNNNINYIDFFNFYTNHSDYNHENTWVNSAPGSAIIFDSLPLSPESSCSATASSNQACSVNKWTGFEKGSGVLIASPKSDFLDTEEQMIIENNLPHITSGDGKWLKKSVDLRDSYLFFSITPDNYGKMLNYSKEGNFKQVMLMDAIYQGGYNKSTTFPNQTSFFSAIDNYAQAGIGIGMHTFINQISPLGGLVDFSSPSIPLKEAIQSYAVGKLENNISTSGSTVLLDKNLTDSTDFNFQYLGIGNPAGSMYSNNEYLIDNEIIACSYSANTLTGCIRDREMTQASSHNIGAEVQILPRCSGYYINSANGALQNLSASSFADFARRINLSLLYIDGDAFLSTPGFPSDANWMNVFNIGTLPYLSEFNNPPVIQNGGGTGNYGAYYTARMASFDGPEFKAKQFTKEYKVPMIAGSSIYNDPLQFVYEMGWWKIQGADFSDGNYDIEATSPDDVNYAMTKVLALNTSMGLELGMFNENNKGIDNLFKTIGLYNTLNYKDARSSLIPQRIKDYLKQPDKEAELNNVSGWNFVEKKVFENYSSWNSTSNFSYDIENPFGEQKLKVEIRPRFDYYQFNDSRHLSLANFSNPSDYSRISISGQNAACSLDSQGNVNISNSGSSYGYCIINITTGSYLGSQGLPGRRGIGLSITGDAKNELVIARLGSYGQYGVRDFKFPVDFSGEKEVILGDPTCDLIDAVNGTNFAFMPSSIPSSISGSTVITRCWNYGYQANDYAMIIIENIKLGQNYSLQFHQLKALQEKSNSTIVNPSITINGKKIVFPVNLSIDDVSPNILDYDGYSNQYQLYTSNYAPLSSGLISTLTVEPGNNNISFSSDTSSSEYSTRGNVRITVSDDEDSDGIPTNGSFGAGTICSGENNFCDDNCPSTYNPDQSSSSACNSGSGNAGGGKINALKNNTVNITPSVNNSEINNSEINNSEITETPISKNSKNPQIVWIISVISLITIIIALTIVIITKVIAIKRIIKNARLSQTPAQNLI